jgi:opacity protein-like surface antigen
MKKIIATTVLGLSIFSAQLLAEDSVYVGLDALSSSNTFTVKNDSTGAEADIDDDSKGFKLKLGVEYESGWRLQGYYLNETYDTPVFDDTNDVLNEIGIDFIKGFEVTPKFSPFVQFGMGYGWMNVDGYTDDSITAVSMKIGAGAMYKVTENIELLAGVDLQYRRWQDISIGTTTYEISEKSTKLYAGLNFHF